MLVIAICFTGSWTNSFQFDDADILSPKKLQKYASTMFECNMDDVQEILIIQNDRVIKFYQEELWYPDDEEEEEDV